MAAYASPSSRSTSASAVIASAVALQTEEVTTLEDSLEHLSDNVAKRPP